VKLDALELTPGLWQWSAAHPEWTPDRAGIGGWEQQMNGFLLEQDEQVVLIDPLLPNDQALVDWLDSASRAWRSHCSRTPART
jgi:hypothetical protein